MRLSSLIQFATFAIPSVTAGSMSFDIRAQADIADEVKVEGKHESDGEFVNIPRNWPTAYDNPEACIDEAGSFNYTTRNGECGDKPLYTVVAAFPDLIEGKNNVHVSMPGYTLSCNFTAIDDESTGYVIGWGLTDYGYDVDVHMTCFNQTGGK